MWPSLGSSTPSFFDPLQPLPTHLKMNRNATFSSAVLISENQTALEEASVPGQLYRQQN